MIVETLLIPIIPLEKQDANVPVYGILLLLFIAVSLLLRGLYMARKNYHAQFIQETGLAPTRVQETEPLPIPQPRVGLRAVLAGWLVWLAVKQKKYPRHQRAMQRTRHFADLRPDAWEKEDNTEEESEPGGVKQLSAPPSYVNPLVGKSYNLPGLLEQGERVFLLAMKGFIWNIHELYIINGRKVTRDGFVMDPKKDPPALQVLKLTKVEWDYLIGPIKATPEGKEPGILRQSGTITIDENNGLTIWPFESAEAAYLHCQEWLAAYIDDEREEKEGSFRS